MSLCKREPADEGVAVCAGHAEDTLLGEAQAGLGAQPRAARPPAEAGRARGTADTPPPDAARSAAAARESAS